MQAIAPSHFRDSVLELLHETFEGPAAEGPSAFLNKGTGSVSDTPVDSAPTAELSARVENWIFWTWFREPLDIITFLCFLLALYWLKRPDREA